MKSETIAQLRAEDQNTIRVLMADPDESLTALYRDPLLQEGFELATVASGLECLARLRDRAPNVLVLEPRMPLGGGEGILDVMGETPHLAAVPVLVLTACRDHQILKRVSRFPVSDYQLKPLLPDRLAGRLHAILAHPKLRFKLADQNGRLECSIARRTDGRINDLRVESINGRVIVHGRSDSHYVKQLALAAVMEAFEASKSQPEKVEMEIDVVSDDNWHFQRSALSETRADYHSNVSAPSNEPDFTNEFRFHKEE